MIEFKNALDARLKSIAQEAVGPSASLAYQVRTFDDHLYDVDLTKLPFWVGFATDTEKEDDEISKYGNWIWHCQMYYLDTTQPNELWPDGKKRRDSLVGAIEKAFEGNHFLADSTGPLSDTDSDGHVEYVWHTDFSKATFDQSGQEGYYTFVSEMYLNVHTSKS